ncbi:MAG: Hpt domain-containing protein [Pseudomonadota bacterium]
MTDGPIDEAIFAELADTTGADFVAVLVTAFLDEAPGMMEDLKAALGQGDADAFRRAAHSIKSNADVFGATALAEIARAMEQDGPSAGHDGLGALEIAFETAASALRGRLDG